MLKGATGGNPTCREFKAEIAQACIEHGHGGLWNSAYDVRKYVSLDMKHCYPAGFKGVGDCSEYYKAFGHLDAQFFRVSLNGEFPSKDFNGFVKISKWALKPNLHPKGTLVRAGKVGSVVENFDTGEVQRRH